MIKINLNHLKLMVRGSYALGILVDGDERLYATRLKSPLIVGISDDGLYIASDVPAILKYCRNVYYIDNQEIAVMKQIRLEIAAKESRYGTRRV